MAVDGKKEKGRVTKVGMAPLFNLFGVVGQFEIKILFIIFPQKKFLDRHGIMFLQRMVLKKLFKIIHGRRIDR
jgi:hypothetical protein